MKPGYNLTDETTIARAGDEQVYWAWYWEPELSRVAREKRCAVRLVSSTTGLSFGGVVPADWDGMTTVELFV